METILESFKVTLDQKERLSEVEKLCYLKSKLTEAENVISGLLMSHENYRVAKSLLQERFEDIHTCILFS